MANNKSINLFDSSSDLTRKAKQRKESVKTYLDESYRKTKQDINNVAEMLLPGKDLVINDNTKTIVNKYSKNAFKKTNSKADYDYSVVTNAIENLYKHNFFDVVSGKIETGKDTMVKAINLAESHKERIRINNQQFKSNENLATMTDKINKFRNIQKQNGSLFLFDLETLGGEDANGIWRPTDITEFSMHEYNAKTGEAINKVDILMSWDKEEGKNKLKRVKKAIENGTIENDNELYVIAHRLSMYGDSDVRYHKSDKGYFVIDNFVDGKKADVRDFKKIERGAALFDYVTDNTDDFADKKMFAKTISYANQTLKQGNSMMGGFNSSVFDDPIVTMMGNKYSKELPELKQYFENGKFSFDYANEDYIDFLGMLKSYREMNSTKDLLGDSIGVIDEKRINRQEHLVKAKYKEAFEKHGLQPHKAADDVSALSFFFTENMDGSDETLFEHIAKNLEDKTAKMPQYDLTTGKYYLEAKSGSNAYQGKNILNFAIDKETGDVFTADNHMIKNGKISKKEFSVGANINQGQIYTLDNIQKIKANSEFVDMMGEAIPQFATNDLYSVTLNMVVADEFAETRIDNLSQVLVFNNETSMNAYLGSTFNAVAENTPEGNIRLLNRDAFDIREYDYIKGKPVFKDVNKNFAKSDAELFAEGVRHKNNTLLTSRSSNAMEGENAYKKIKNILDYQKEVKKTVGHSLKDRELNYILSSNVAAGEMPFTIDDVKLEHLRKKSVDILGYKGELFDSSVDNVSSYMNLVNKNETYYTNLMTLLESNKKFATMSPNEQKYMFKHVDKQLRTSLASNIHSNSNDAIKRDILQNSPLQAPISRFKGMYEIDLSGMPGYKAMNYNNIANAAEEGIVRLNLNKAGNVDFDLVNAVTKAIHGDKKIRPQDEFELGKKDFRKFINMFLEDETFKEHITEKKTIRRKGGEKYTEKRLNKFGQELKEIATSDIDYNHIDVAQRIANELRAIKEKDSKAGLISKSLFMKDLEGNSGFINALNSNEFVKSMESQVNNIVESTNIRELDGSINKTQEYVKKHILDKFVPKATKGNALQENAREEMLGYLTNIVNTADKSGISVALSEGTNDLVLSAGGRIVPLELPKIMEDADSGIWYLKSGNMQNQLMNKLNIGVKGSSVDMKAGTTFGAKVNKISSTVERVYEKEGTYGALEEIKKLTGLHRRAIQQGPTINNFNGNNHNSNSLIDLQDISNLMEPLFNKKGSLNHLIRNEDFLDKNLQETLGKEIEDLVAKNINIENLSPMATRDLSKNTGHILQIVGKHAKVEGTVEDMIRNISMTTNDKQMSSMIGILGNMPTFSPQAFIDNLQRPPILAAGNAIPIRAEAIKKLEGEFSGVLSGNLISSAEIDKKTMRYVAGVGKTTTDVMMDIAYVSTNALEIIKDNNVNKVLAQNTVEGKYQEHLVAMFEKMANMNTYEQERHMDARIAEKLYGMMPAKIQNVSASKDIVSAIKAMDLDEADKQLKQIISVNGDISFDKEGQLIYKKAIGKEVKRGQSVLKVMGFNDTIDDITPNMQNGIFIHRYQKSNGMTLTDKEITNILNQHKDAFVKDGKVINKVEAINQLEKIMQTNYSARGIYRIEDMNAAGYLKPTTSSAEKGMTNLNYVKTGEADETVKKFFKKIGRWNDIQGTTLTDDALELIIHNTNNKTLNEALKDTFGSVDKLRQAVDVERNMFNKFLYSDVFNNSAHMLVNDGVVKHGGSGQIQFGMLNKAIDKFRTFNNYSLEETSTKVKNIIERNKEFQFLENLDLNTGKKDSVKFEVIDGKLKMTNINSSIDKLSTSNVTKLENLITELDKQSGGGLVHKEGYIQKYNNQTKNIDLLQIGKEYNNTAFKTKDGKVARIYEDNGEDVFKIDKIFGDWRTETLDGKKVYTAPITKESVKLLPDVETQTGTEHTYFEIKKTLVDLKTRKNLTNDQLEKTRLSEQINTLETELRNYESVSKRMTLGVTEMQLLERMQVTNKQVDEIQKLIDTNKLTDEILATEALKGKIVRNSEGKLVADESLKGPALSHWIGRFKDNLTFNPLEETRLTAQDVKTEEFKHLKKYYEKAEQYDMPLGKESAEKAYKYESAVMASKFNESGDPLLLKKMQDHGFEVKRIDDINFEVDELAKKNIIVDLGEDFSFRKAGSNLDFNIDKSQRYIASPGLGHRLGQTNEETEILTNGQKEIKSLRKRYDEWKEIRHDDKKGQEALVRLSEQVTETTKAIDKSVFGKNAFADSLHKVQVDDVNYRYKASGIVTSEFTSGLQKAFKNDELEFKVDNQLLRRSEINGKSIYDWQKNGVHYDYKFVSMDAMEDMGMFKKSTMEMYGAKSRDEMIEKLKKHGTMDITDRYPNNKNDSMLPTHVFLDEKLQGNQTKVGGVSGLKMNLDHDGDSVSSFALRYKMDDGSFVDYGAFINNKESIKINHPEAYKEFSKLDTLTTTRAATDNRYWMQKVDKILVDDVKKNSNLGDLRQTALVPDGNSILGKISPSGISNVGSLSQVNQNEKAVNELLESAKGILETSESLRADLSKHKISPETFNGGIHSDKAEKILDKALTVMEKANSQDMISNEALEKYQADAIRRIAIDKYATGTAAKTGVATTGSINLSTRHVKQAAHEKYKDGRVELGNLFNDIFDIPEQEAISSKKIISAFDDTKARDMTDILGKMFKDSSNTMGSSVTMDNNLKDFRNWFEQYGKDKVEDIYNQYGTRILNKNTIQQVEKNPSKKFDAIMDVVESELKTLSNDEYFNAYRINQKTRNKARMGAGYALNDSMGSMDKLIDSEDASFVVRQMEKNKIDEMARIRQQNARNFASNPDVDRRVAKETVANSNKLMEAAIERMSRNHNGPGLGTAVLGLAAGLLVSGYASGNPLNDKQASQVAGEEQQQPKQTMSIPEFMDKQSGFVTGNSQQGYIINIKADTKKGRKHVENVMKQAAAASVGGAVSVNMNIKNAANRGVTDKDIENYLDKFI